MPIDNGVGLLAQVLMNQQAGRQRAAAQTAQMQQQQDLTDQGQEFQQQSLAQQLQAQARAQAIHAQMAAAAQAAQDQRAEAADTRRAGREDARDQNRATREDAMKAAQLAFERERLAKEDEWKRMPPPIHRSESVVRYPDRQPPAPHQGNNDVRRTAAYAKAQSLKSDYLDASKNHTAVLPYLLPEQVKASEAEVGKKYRKWMEAVSAVGGGVAPQSGGGEGQADDGGLE